MATKVGFIVAPSDVEAGENLIVRVAIQDANGTTVAGADSVVTIAFGTNPASATLVGTITVTAVDGVAEFDDLSIANAAAGYALVASSPGLASATSGAFTVSPGPAAKLKVGPIGSTFKSMALIDPIVVRVTDANDNLVTTGAHDVTMSMGTNPSGGTMMSPAGALTKPTTNGQTDFTGLTVDKVGTGYTLTASAPGLETASSSAFAITPGDPAKVAWLDQPIGTEAAGIVLPAFRVVIRDASENVVTDQVRNVFLSVATAPSGGKLATFPLGGSSRPTVDGVTTFTG